jgi:hypothetical protein
MATVYRVHTHYMSVTLGYGSYDSALNAGRVGPIQYTEQSHGLSSIHPVNVRVIPRKVCVSLLITHHVFIIKYSITWQHENKQTKLSEHRVSIRGEQGGRVAKGNTHTQNLNVLSFSDSEKKFLYEGSLIIL